MSTKTGVAPTAMIARTVAMKVLAGAITSSPGPILERAERELDRRQAGADADRMAGADVGGILGLEPFDRRAHYEIAARDQLAERLLDRGAQRRVLGLEIDERYLHRGHAYFFSPRPR